ncbi:hypothetical protein Q5P01_001171 [Channa striata]|uniref:Uncharacterized protein n=1 Tax=Channa striata TaxID=64152 RepID=A0AA88NYD2_CHASR|nr:hypothetical protein Q5P01_001171 [Channa striata]
MAATSTYRRNGPKRRKRRFQGDGDWTVTEPHVDGTGSATVCYELNNERRVCVLRPSIKLFLADPLNLCPVGCEVDCRCRVLWGFGRAFEDRTSGTITTHDSVTTALHCGENKTVCPLP